MFKLDYVHVFYGDNVVNITESITKLLEISDIPN